MSYLTDTTLDHSSSIHGVKYGTLQCILAHPLSLILVGSSAVQVLNSPTFEALVVSSAGQAGDFRDSHPLSGFGLFQAAAFGS